MELKIETRNLDLRKGWKDKIEEEKAKLIRTYAGFVLRLRVTIESTSNYKEGGCEVRIVAAVPNDTVVVKRWGENVRSLLVEAFDVLGLQLKSITSKKQNKKGAKLQGAVLAGDSSGIIKKVFPDESYGFIMTVDEQEVFFHENSLKDLSIDDLSEGDAVLMNVTEGDKGPQATWVRAAKI
jgi:cold shock CspA family protein/ribosome-associated translation inhibitor RaiA